MSNVNNLNGVPNFGHGEAEAVVIPIAEETAAIDEKSSSVETEVKKVHRSKVRSAAQKALGGKY